MPLPTMRFRPLTPADVRVERVGPAQYPVITIDDVLENAEEIRTLALHSRFFRPDSKWYYPGYEASCGSPGYSEGVAWITEYIWRHVYGQSVGDHDFGDTVGKVFFACFAPRMDVKYINVHVDGLDKLAAVLHLSPDTLQTGTGFWRDRLTDLQAYIPDSAWAVRQSEKLLGFDYVDRLAAAFERTPGLEPDTLLKTLMFERMITPPFPDADYGDWELQHVAPAKFNRLVIYPGWMFHSIVHAGYAPGFSIDRARITLNAFLNLPVSTNRRRVGAVPVAGMVR